MSCVSSCLMPSPETMALTVAGAAIAVLAMGIVASVGGRRAKIRLHDRNLLLDGALNNMSQGVNMFDADGYLLLANDRYLRMYGLSGDVVKPGCSIRDLVAARVKSGTFFSIDAERYIADLSTRLQSRTPSTKTLELTDGRVISVSNQPMADGGWVVTHEDITDRHRAGKELERTRNFLDTVLENVPATIVVKDARDLRYVLLNRASEEFYGIPRDRRRHGSARSPAARGRRAAGVRGPTGKDARQRPAHGDVDPVVDPRRRRQAAISGQRARGRDRSQAGGGAHRPHGALRRAHRSAQPCRLQRMLRRHARARRLG